MSKKEICENNLQNNFKVIAITQHMQIIYDAHTVTNKYIYT